MFRVSREKWIPGLSIVDLSCVVDILLLVDLSTVYYLHATLQSETERYTNNVNLCQTTRLLIYVR